MNTPQKTNLLIWTSGFFTAIALAHVLPFLVRHRLEIGGQWLDYNIAFWTTFVSAILAISSFQYAKVLKRGKPENQV